MDNKIEFYIEISHNEAEEEQEAANKMKEYEIREIQPIDESKLPPLVEASFIEPVSILAASTLAILGTRLVNHWLRSREKGVQIDLRGEIPVISRLAGVPFGFLVILNKDGTATTHKAEYKKSQDILPLLKSILVEVES